MDDEYDVDGGLDMYESRKKKGTKVCLLCMLCAWHAKTLIQSMRVFHDYVPHCPGHISLVGLPKLVNSSSL